MTNAIYSHSHASNKRQFITMFSSSIGMIFLTAIPFAILRWSSVELRMMRCSDDPSYATHHDLSDASPTATSNAAKGTSYPIASDPPTARGSRLHPPKLLPGISILHGSWCLSLLSRNMKIHLITLYWTLMSSSKAEVMSLGRTTNDSETCPHYSVLRFEAGKRKLLVIHFAST